MKQTSNIEPRKASPRGEHPTSNVERSMDELSTLNSQPPAAPERGEGGSTSLRFVSRIAEFIIGGVFIYAGVLKVIDPVQFARDIDNYKILPWTIGVRLAFYLPWLEIFCGLALITRKLYLGGLSILTALIIVFITASIIAKARGLDITCGCFGHASDNLGFAWHLALDFVLLAGLIFLMRTSSKKLV